MLRSSPSQGHQLQEEEMRPHHTITNQEEAEIDNSPTRVFMSIKEIFALSVLCIAIVDCSDVLSASRKHIPGGKHRPFAII